MPRKGEVVCDLNVSPVYLDFALDESVECSVTAPPVSLDSAETDGAKTRPVPAPVFGLTPVPNAEVDRVSVRREVSGCVNEREKRVSAVATLALAGTLPWASVAA
jgi:hypothetical protein